MLFKSFDLHIVYDKTQRRVQISATITEAVAQALQNAKTSRRRPLASDRKT